MELLGVEDVGEVEKDDGEVERDVGEVERDVGEAERDVVAVVESLVEGATLEDMVVDRESAEAVRMAASVSHAQVVYVLPPALSRTVTHSVKTPNTLHTPTISIQSIAPVVLCRERCDE